MDSFITLQVIISVNDTAKLAENLLPIAGGRLRSHLSKVYGQTFLNDVSRISPTLRTYLLGLDYVRARHTIIVPLIPWHCLKYMDAFLSG